MGYVIALAGKGGTGKTTLAALIVRCLKEKKLGSECLTLCPYISDRSVNSNECSDCRYNGGIKQTRNKETKIIESFVICYFEDKEGK